jgi:uncharacterized protein YfiM (DUF2279 family)
MKKIVTLVIAVMAYVGMLAAEKTVWEGNEAISWNTEVAPGTQFETPEGIFSGLKKENIIRIYTTTTYEDPQYVITYKKGDSWEWTDLATTVAEGVISYTIEDETIAKEIADRGLVIRGQAYSIIKITIDSEAPKPAEGEQTVWEGSEAISWNTEVAPGTQFETPEGIFSGLKKDNVIRIYTTTTYEEPQYVITYKKGDSWEWTDLATTIADGVISYTVEDETIAKEIADRGLVVRGQAYTITKITVASSSTTGISPVNSVVLSNTNIYNLCGQKVTIAPKGLIIKDGKKYVVK